MAERFNGRVKLFIPTKGYGFIIPNGGGADLMFHSNECNFLRSTAIEQDMRVSFERLQKSTGWHAVKVELIWPDEACPTCGKPR